MPNFKPQVTYKTFDSQRDYWSGDRKSPYITRQYATYAELKRNLKEHLEACIEDTVSVSRSRRGEWGEFFEHWGLDAERKPVIVKQGWM